MSLSLSLYIYIHIYIYIYVLYLYMCVCVSLSLYIYIYIERERDSMGSATIEGMFNPWPYNTTGRNKKPNRTELNRPNRTEPLNSGTGRNWTRKRTEPDRATTRPKNAGRTASNRETTFSEPNRVEPMNFRKVQNRSESNRFLPGL